MWRNRQKGQRNAGNVPLRPMLTGKKIGRGIGNSRCEYENQVVFPAKVCYTLQVPTVQCLPDLRGGAYSGYCKPY